MGLTWYLCRPTIRTMITITPRQEKILNDIRSNPDDTTLYAIAKRIGCSRGSIRKSIGDLQKKGLVTVKQIRQFVHLTELAL